MGDHRGQACKTAVHTICTWEAWRGCSSLVLSPPDPKPPALQKPCGRQRRVIQQTTEQEGKEGKEEAKHVKRNAALTAFSLQLATCAHRPCLEGGAAWRKGEETERQGEEGGCATNSHCP